MSRNIRTESNVFKLHLPLFLNAKRNGMTALNVMKDVLLTGLAPIVCRQLGAQKVQNL